MQRYDIVNIIALQLRAALIYVETCPRFFLAVCVTVSFTLADRLFSVTFRHR